MLSDESVRRPFHLNTEGNEADFFAFPQFEDRPLWFEEQLGGLCSRAPVFHDK